MSSEIAVPISPDDKCVLTEPYDPGSNPSSNPKKRKKRKKRKLDKAKSVCEETTPETEHFEHKIKKAMRLFKKAEDECDEKEKIFRAAEDAYFRADNDWKAAFDLKLKLEADVRKLEADAFGDEKKKKRGFLPPQ